jgi:hypothetical protein
MVAIGWPNSQINILKIYNKYESYGGLDKMNINIVNINAQLHKILHTEILKIYVNLIS